jgi:ubiquinone/menaquinone biosynthesis C-methylase UbiE
MLNRVRRVGCNTEVMSDRAIDAQRRVWTIGDYPIIARHLLPISVETVEAVGIRSGDRVLDVGVGSGNAAIEAVRRGATVTGIDLTPAQIERARLRCADEGVQVDLRVANAEELDVPDAGFDVVLSVMGMIFAPNHVRAMAEMARACRPGGTVAITTWAEGGWSSRWRSHAAHLLPAPPPGSPTPDEWGDPDEVVRRFAAAGLRAKVERRSFAFRFSSEEEALETFVGAAGPYVQFMETASSLGRADEALNALRAALAESNEASDGTCRLLAPYLLASSHR